jgi:hypothetical protein
LRLNWWVSEVQACSINLKTKKVTISVAIEGCRNGGQAGSGVEEVRHKSVMKKLPTPGCGCEEKVKEAFMALFK